MFDVVFRWKYEGFFFGTFALQEYPESEGLQTTPVLYTSTKHGSRKFGLCQSDNGGKKRKPPSICRSVEHEIQLVQIREKSALTNISKHVGEELVQLKPEMFHVMGFSFTVHPLAYCSVCVATTRGR